MFRTQQEIWLWLAENEHNRVKQKITGVICGFYEGTIWLFGKDKATSIAFDVPEHWAKIRR